jgi:hypothetical protein
MDYLAGFAADSEHFATQDQYNDGKAISVQAKRVLGG